MRMASFEQFNLQTDPKNYLTGRTAIDAMRDISRARRYVGLAITSSPENDALDRSDWGAPVVNTGFVLYAKVFPHPSRTISISNVWDGWLVAYKARTHPDQPFSYSMASFLPWDVVNVRNASITLRTERIKYGIEPIYTLPSAVVPCYACRTTDLDAKEAIVMHKSVKNEENEKSDAQCLSIGEPFVNIDHTDVRDATSAQDLKKHPLMECVATQGTKNIVVDVTQFMSTKRNKRTPSKSSTFTIPSSTEYPWQCATHGISVEFLREQVNASFSILTKTTPSLHSTDERVRSRIMECYKEVTARLFACNDDCALEAQTWACRAVKSMCHAQLCFLRDVPVLRECLPYSLRDPLQMPLMMAICVHVAVNHELFGLDMCVAQHQIAPLRRELALRLNCVTTGNELALDALIMRAIRRSTEGTEDDECFAPPGLDERGKLAMSTVRGLREGGAALPAHVTKHLRECASIGFNVINTFYAARCRADIKSHGVRSYFHGLTTTNAQHPSSAFDDVHARVAERLRDLQSKMHHKPALIAPWPLAIVPESTYHRLLVCDTLQPADAFARDVMRANWAAWHETAERTNGLNMFLQVLKFGWASLRIRDAQAFLMSDKLETVCVACTRTVHSTELALPFQMAHCHDCMSRMCFECMSESRRVCRDGFVCRRCVVSGSKA